MWHSTVPKKLTHGARYDPASHHQRELSNRRNNFKKSRPRKSRRKTATCQCCHQASLNAIIFTKTLERLIELLESMRTANNQNNRMRDCFAGTKYPCSPSIQSNRKNKKMQCADTQTKLQQESTRNNIKMEMANDTLEAELSRTNIKQQKQQNTVLNQQRMVSANVRNRRRMANRNKNADTTKASSNKNLNRTRFICNYSKTANNMHHAKSQNEKCVHATVSKSFNTHCSNPFTRMKKQRMIDHPPRPPDTNSGTKGMQLINNHWPSTRTMALGIGISKRWTSQNFNIFSSKCKQIKIRQPFQ